MLEAMRGLGFLFFCKIIYRKGAQTLSKSTLEHMVYIWWYMSVIPTTQEVEAGGTQVQGQQNRDKVRETLSQKQKNSSGRALA
jgi:hypothetical protein